MAEARLTNKQRDKMNKVLCEDCYEAEAEITYLIGVYKTEWSSCLACLSQSIQSKLTHKIMRQAVADSED